MSLSNEPHFLSSNSAPESDYMDADRTIAGYFENEREKSREASRLAIQESLRNIVNVVSNNQYQSHIRNFHRRSQHTVDIAENSGVDFVSMDDELSSENDVIPTRPSEQAGAMRQRIKQLATAVDEARADLLKTVLRFGKTPEQAIEGHRYSMEPSSNLSSSEKPPLSGHPWKPALDGLVLKSLDRKLQDQIPQSVQSLRETIGVVSSELSESKGVSRVERALQDTQDQSFRPQSREWGTVTQGSAKSVGADLSTFLRME